MRSEICGNWWWARGHLLGIAVLTTILIILTLLVDGGTPGDGIIRIYNEIYILTLPVYALVIPLSIKSFLRLHLQFGANRKKLFYATEFMSGIVLVAGAMIVMGMNEFSSTIYDTVEIEVWEVSIWKWVLFFLGSKLLWVISQRTTYTPDGEATKMRMFKGGVLGAIYMASVVVAALMTRGTFEMSPIPSENIVLGIVATIFVIMCILIALVQYSNYRLFMKMEV